MSQCVVLSNGVQCENPGHEFGNLPGERTWVCDEHLGRTPRPQPTCTACGAALKPVFGSAVQHEGLRVIFVGGYGMFFDNIDGDPKIEICEGCCWEMCEKLPWVGRVLGRNR